MQVSIAKVFTLLLLAAGRLLGTSAARLQVPSLWSFVQPPEQEGGTNSGIVQVNQNTLLQIKAGVENGGAVEVLVDVVENENLVAD